MRNHTSNSERFQIELSYHQSLTDDFRSLTAALDRELREMNGELQTVYAQYNQLDNIRDIVLAHKGGEAIGCCSMKYYSEGVFEIKRVFVSPECRKYGVASRMMRYLEEVADSKGANELILETGDVLVSAIRMYKKLGFEVIPNYGQYVNMKSSICMSKRL